MQVVPLSVGRTAQSWDEQHLDVQAAAVQVADAGSAGFTSAVSGAASRFLTGWERHLRGLGETCEGKADGLRADIADYLATDDLVSTDHLLLQQYLREER